MKHSRRPTQGNGQGVSQHPQTYKKCSTRTTPERSAKDCRRKYVNTCHMSRKNAILLTNRNRNPIVKMLFN